MYQTAECKNPLQPQIDSNGVNERVVSDDRVEETLPQRRCEHWLNNSRVVPDIKRAPENLWDQRCQSGQQKAVTCARRVALNFAIRGQDSFRFGFWDLLLQAVSMGENSSAGLTAPDSPVRIRVAREENQ